MGSVGESPSVGAARSPTPTTSLQGDVDGAMEVWADSVPDADDALCAHVTPQAEAELLPPHPDGDEGEAHFDAILQPLPFSAGGGSAPSRHDGR